jgi:hexosaminidase
MHNVKSDTSGEKLVPNQKIIPYVWNSNWGTHDDFGYKLANSGYKVVLCTANNLYFDFAYSKDPQEPGLYWSGLVDTRKPFEMVPFNVIQTATDDIMGNPLDPEAYEDHVKLTVEGSKNVLGLQGQLWSETVKGPEMLEYYLFPKMIGLAERAWAKDPEWSNLPKRSQRLEELEQHWNLFANRLAQKELIRLDHLWNGVNYRVPLPGAIIQDGKLKANVAFPGLLIRYTTDGSEPNANSLLYQGPIEAKKPVKLKAFTATGKSSRTSILSF